MPTLTLSVPLSIEALQPAMPRLINLINDEPNTARVGLSGAEVQLTKDLDRESFIRLYPPMTYKRLDKVASAPDPLYNESSAPIFLPNVNIPLYFNFEPTQKELKKFGLEAPQEAILLYSISWCDTYLDSFTPQVGDRFVPVGGVVEFEVLTFKFTDYFGNTMIPLHWVAGCKAIRTGKRVDDNPPVDPQPVNNSDMFKLH